MKRMLVIAAAASLLAVPSLADHCDTLFGDADAAVVAAVTVEDNLVNASDALIESALDMCADEELTMMEVEIDSPMLDPDYVTLGMSMLVNAIDLVTE